MSLHTTVPSSSQRSGQRRYRGKAWRSTKRWISTFHRRSSCKSGRIRSQQVCLNRRTRPWRKSLRLLGWLGIRIQGKQRPKWCLPCIRFAFRNLGKRRVAFLCVAVWKRLRAPVSNRIPLVHLLRNRFGCTWKERERLKITIFVALKNQWQWLHCLIGFSTKNVSITSTLSATFGFKSKSSRYVLQVREKS